MKLNLRTVLYAIVAFAALAFVYVILVNDKARAEGVAKAPVARAASPAAASPWSSCHVGVHAGGAASQSEIGGLTTLNSEGAIGGLGAGCDWQMPGTPFVIGVLTDYSWRDLGTTLGAARVEMKGVWTAAGRVGVAPSDKLLIYALGGWTQSTASTSLAIPDSFDGMVIGGGIEALINQAFSVGLEYRNLSYGSERAPLAAGGFTWDPSEQQILLKASWRFYSAK